MFNGPNCMTAQFSPTGAVGPYSGDEGAAIALDGAMASDADGDPLTTGQTEFHKAK